MFSRATFPGVRNAEIRKSNQMYDPTSSACVSRRAKAIDDAFSIVNIHCITL